jgi:hypothetical protein
MLRTVKIGSLAALWLVPLLVLVSAFSSDWIPAWKAVGVPAMLPRFADLSTIAEGLETLRQGKDPLVTNPPDPLNRPVNYPRVWLQAFSALRINVHNVWLIAIPFCACYLACMSVLIAQAKYAGDVVILLLASLSISPLLAMERGNNDLFVFSLVFLGCCATNRYLKSAALATASLLKIFPIAGMIADAVRRPARQRLVPLFLSAFVLALLAWQWRDIDLIRHGTPISRVLSYGVLSFEQEITHFFPDWLFYLFQLGWIVLAGCWLLALSVVDLAWKHSFGLDPDLFDSPQGEMFTVFGAIYVFTYAVGSNWDYRLIMLLPTIPFALQLVHASRLRVWAVGYLALVGIAENALRLEGHGGTLLGHLATFPLFLLIAAVLTRQLKSIAFSASAGDPAAVPSSPGVLADSIR